RKTSARSTKPSSISIGTFQSIRIASRTSERSCNDAMPASRNLCATGGYKHADARHKGRASLKTEFNYEKLTCTRSLLALTPLHLGLLFQHGTNRSRVERAQPGLHRLEVDGLRRIEHGRRYFDLLGIAADHRHILVPDVDLHGDVAVVALDHHRRA